VFISSGGTGTSLNTSRYGRSNRAGVRRLGGAASPVPDADKVTPGMTPRPAGGLGPGETPSSPDSSPDAGASPWDPDDDMLCLPRDALALHWDALVLDRDALMLDRDALNLYPRPLPTPDILQGTKWELGMTGLVTGPAPLGDKVRTSGTRQGGGGGVRPLAFHATWNPTFTISSLTNVTFHVARFLRDSLYASNIRYNGLHLFSGSYGHADRPDPACGHPAPR